MLYMVKKKTGYFFRLRFPKDVAGYFGRTEIIRSLHTRRYSEAKRLVTSYAAKAERVFTMVRSGTLDDEMIKKIVNEFLEMAYSWFLFCGYLRSFCQKRKKQPWAEAVRYRIHPHHVLLQRYIMRMLVVLVRRQ